MAGHVMPTNGVGPEAPLRSLDTLMASIRAELEADIDARIEARVQECMAQMIGPALMAGVIDALRSLTVNVAAPTVNVDVPEGAEPAITVSPAPVTVQRAVRQRIVYDDQGRISHLEPM